MLKRVAWAFLHTNKMHAGINLPRVSTHPLNFISQEVIKELIAADTPAKNIDNVNLSKVKDRMVIHEQQFKLGAEAAYKIILSDFSNHADFVATSYCTPQLSFTLNFLNFRIRNIGVDVPQHAERTPTISMTILGQWIDMEETRSNNNILGLWDIDHIKSEIAAGFMGPEIKVVQNDEDDMTYIPIKQTVRLAYKVEYDNSNGDCGDGHDNYGSAGCKKYERVDVFDWERSLSCPVEKEEWTIANINSVLI